MADVMSSADGRAWCALCRRHEVSRWWWAECRRARPPGAGAAGSGGVVRGGGQRPGGRDLLPGDPDVGEPVAAGASRRRAAGAGVEGAGWDALQAQPRATGRAGGAARRRPGRVGMGGPVLDAGPHRRGGTPPVWGELHPGRAGPAAAPARLERAGSRPASRRAGRGAEQRLAARDLAGDKRTAADLGAWLVFEDASGQGLRPPKGRTWGRRGRTPVVQVTAANSPRLSLAALVATKPGCRPRLIYRTHPGRQRGGRRKGLTETDYAALLDAAHQQLGGPLVVVWDNLNHPPQRGDGQAGGDSALADGLPAAAVRPRAEPGRAGVVASAAIPGQPHHAHHHRTHRAGEDPPHADAVPPRPARRLPRRHQARPRTPLRPDFT